MTLNIYYLEQLFSNLKKSRIVKAVKGTGRGYIFEKPPSKMNLDDIRNAVGGNIEITKCIIQKTTSCRQENKKYNTHSYLEAYLARTVLKDVTTKNFFFKNR